MKKIAIIGSGISGLTCAYYLSRRYRVTVFEANDYIGGHTHTVPVDHAGEQADIDTGFIVFNDRTYPNFIRLLHELEVPYQPTEMSFSVRNDRIGLEYNGHNLKTLFAQRANLVNPTFWRLLWDIQRFNRDVRKAARTGSMATIGDYLEANRFGALFAENYLLPMIAAIWSMGLEESRQFPLKFFVQFFENHGLLNLIRRPQWYSIIGGSHSYIPPLTAPYRDQIRLSCEITGIERGQQSVKVSGPWGEERFDEVILACHSDQALKLLAEPSEAERQVLGDLTFTDNRVILHTDTSLLPAEREAWASWNYRVEPDNQKPTLTYNMNILQCLDTRQVFLVTLNQEIPPDKILATFSYSHPAYTPKTLNAQVQWRKISGAERIHYCGAYWFNGFHEDGVNSALRVCRDLGVTP